MSRVQTHAPWGLTGGEGAERCGWHSPVRNRLGHRRPSVALLRGALLAAPRATRSQTLGPGYGRKRGSGGHELTFKPQSAQTCPFRPFLVP